VKKIEVPKEKPIVGTDDEDIEPSDHRSILLSLIKSLPPNGFERLSQRLLRESGFQKVVVTGKTGDGGIDGYGILQVNPFVSFNVLFQCKRYQGAVTPSQIRDFRGAMMGRADKGIIITTGTFTLDARKEARRDGVPPIELVDGDTLVQMFEQLQLGLIPRTTFDIDEKFFDDFKK
jgi:restriction system protein